MNKAILLDIPVPIHTERLMIRPPMPGDGSELNASVLESFEDLHVWMPWAASKPTLEESEVNVRRAYASWILREDLRLSLFDKVTGRMIGSSGFHRIDWEVRRFEIGYWIRKSFSGRGYITESTAALSKFAFEVLGARRVEIRCDVDNQRSRAIPERLGFELEAVLKGDELKPFTDEPRDTAVYVRFDAKSLLEVGARWK